MKLWRAIRFGLVMFLTALLACPPAHGLVTLNDSHDHINLATSFTVTRDSNIFASADNEGDFAYSTSVAITYQRRAGWIGVNATASMGASRFGKHTSENFSNPSYALELTKQSGRTTGALTLSAARESRADSAVNIRNTSWNYGAGLNVQYPIRGRATITAGLNYASHKYTDATAFASLSTYAANIDSIYLLPHERDLITGYRYRYSETSRDTVSTDHGVNVGVGGKLIAGLNGSVRVGYQLRSSESAAHVRSTFQSWTGSTSVSYAINRKTAITATIAKDFSTTATDASVDNLTTSIDAQYAYSKRWSLTANAGWGDSQFLGESGRIVLSTSPIVILGPHRHDQFANWGASLSYNRSQHLNFALSYSWFKNWSTITFADFVRSQWSLSLSSNW